ncbi:hypothetical protein ACFFRL_19595 [Agromyces hippuratus]|uniref:hypothetical protein n=1 Tax=Agromyces hippuratus TaxID=286438 RepID=UPI0035EC66FA
MRASGRGVGGDVGRAVGRRGCRGRRRVDGEHGQGRRDPALIGDLTLLHDVGSMLLGEGEQRPRVQLIVGNDGGGTIFDSLEVAASAPAEAFDRVQFTPQHVDLAALAAAYGWSYTRAATRAELHDALGTRVDGPSILEVPLPR